ncbi:glycosyltransferase, partial [Alphaproteobacteria bacterium]|nr:glycosyltransferase [Alphaproteobacteria bacterium]
IDFLKKINQIKKFYNKKNYDNGNFFILPRRLVKRTGVQQFLNELIKKKSFKKFNFYITGEGNLSNDIKLFCNRYDNLKFVGKIDQNLLTFLIFISKGVIIPSVEAEGFCIVAKEAKILNKKIFHTNQGGLKECLAGYYKQTIFNIYDFNMNIFSNSKFKKKLSNLIIENDDTFLTKLIKIIKN